MKAIHVPGSYVRTISNSTRMFLDMQGIALLEGDVWGHRKDINEYSEIKPEVFDRIQELKKEGLSESDMLGRLGRETGLSRDIAAILAVFGWESNGIPAHVTVESEGLTERTKRDRRFHILLYDCSSFHILPFISILFPFSSIFKISSKNS